MLPDRRSVHHAVCLLTLRLGAAALSLVAISLLLTFPGCSGAKGIADEQVVLRTAENVVLVYTDNSPGAIIIANAMHYAVRLQGYDTLVTVDENEFMELLSQRQWDSVLVVTRYESTTPAYRNALVKYVDAGGRAEICMWQDDHNNTEQGPVLLAPTVMQIWYRGETIRDYALCHTTRDRDMVALGYVMNDFAGVTSDAIHAVVEPGCNALVAGAYQSIPALPQTFSDAFKLLCDELNTVRKRYAEAIQLCEELYGTLPGDIRKLQNCITTFGENLQKLQTSPFYWYGLRKKIADLPPEEG